MDPEHDLIAPPASLFLRACVTLRAHFNKSQHGASGDVSPLIDRRLTTASDSWDTMPG